MPISCPTASNPPRNISYTDISYEAELSSLVVAYLLYEGVCINLGKKVEEALRTAQIDTHEERPSDAALSGIVGLIEKVSKINPLAEPETSVFCGEAIVTWRHGQKEVTLLSRGQADDPKIHHYEVHTGAPSEHSIISNASARALMDQLKWLYKQ